MTTASIASKIKSHVLDFPDDKAADIASLFGVKVIKVYEAKEALRRARLLPRSRRRSKAKKVDLKPPVKVLQPPVLLPVPPVVKQPLVNMQLYEITSLKAEIDYLNSIIVFLEEQLGLHKDK